MSESKSNTPPVVGDFSSQLAVGRVDDPADAKTFSQFSRALGIGSFDAIVFTDGSGSRKDMPAGWAGLIVQRTETRPICLTGSHKSVSVQEAELRAVFDCLSHMVEQKLGDRSGGYRVSVVTDSSYVAGQLARLSMDPVSLMNFKRHKMLWTGIQFAMRVGLVVSSHHVSRNSNKYMELVDTLSKTARLSVDVRGTEQATDDLMNKIEQHWAVGDSRTKTLIGKMHHEPYWK